MPLQSENRVSMGRALLYRRRGPGRGTQLKAETCRLVHCLMQKVSHGVEGMSILKVSIRQIKAARALLGWSQNDLAKHSGVSAPTVKRLEAAEGDIGGRAETGESLVAALQKAGVASGREVTGLGVSTCLKKRGPSAPRWAAKSRPRSPSHSRTVRLKEIPPEKANFKNNQDAARCHRARIETLQ